MMAMVAVIKPKMVPIMVMRVFLRKYNNEQNNTEKTPMINATVESKTRLFLYSWCKEMVNSLVVNSTSLFKSCNIGTIPNWM